MGHTETMAEGDEQYEMETTESGASDTHMVEAGQIRKGGYIMIKGKACKVKDVSVSKTGKHGHAKCKFLATDDDNTTTQMLKDFTAKVDAGEEIEIYCTVL